MCAATVCVSACTAAPTPWSYAISHEQLICCFFLVPHVLEMLRRKPQVTDKIRQRISIALGLLKLFPDQLYTSNDLYPASNTNVYYRVKEAQATALALTKVGSNSQTAVDYSARVVDPNRFLGDVRLTDLWRWCHTNIARARFSYSRPFCRILCS